MRSNVNVVRHFLVWLPHQFLIQATRKDLSVVLRGQCTHFLPLLAAYWQHTQTQVDNTVNCHAITQKCTQERYRQLNLNKQKLNNARIQQTTANYSFHALMWITMEIITMATYVHALRRLKSVDQTTIINSAKWLYAYSGCSEEALHIIAIWSFLTLLKQGKFFLFFYPLTLSSGS